MKISGNNASIVMPNLYWFIGISAVEHSKWEGGGVTVQEQFLANFILMVALNFPENRLNLL